MLQAAALGASFDLARTVIGLLPGTSHRLTLDDGAHVACHSVILACGVTYRRLGVAPIEELVGHGVFYGASTASARGLQDAEVVVVGAGNSGGQAAVHLARYAARVTLVARGASLQQTMSTYLVREIAMSPRIDVRRSTDIVHGGGDGHLEWLELSARATDAGGQSTETRERIRADALFILIGTVTRTNWLPHDVQRDDHGFVVTGDALDPSRWPLERPPHALETSVPGVFAARDVRANNVKRVASAVGEGAITVPMVHTFLQALRANP